MRFWESCVCARVRTSALSHNQGNLESRKCPARVRSLMPYVSPNAFDSARGGGSCLKKRHPMVTIPFVRYGVKESKFDLRSRGYVALGRGVVITGKYKVRLA